MQIHKTVEVSSSASIGENVSIYHNSQVLDNAKIGDNTKIGHNCLIGKDVLVGNNVKIQSNIDVWEGVELEDYVFVGPSVVFTNVANPRSEFPKDSYIKTLIKKGATLGANSTIVCGIIIGKYAFVGAGAVVIEDVLDNQMVVGNPAKPIGWMCSCGKKLESNKCECGKEYEIF